MGNDDVCKVMGIGTIKIKMFDGIVRTLADVRCIPNLKKDLISLGTLDSIDCSISIKGGVMKVSKGAMVIMKAGTLERGRYAGTLQAQDAAGSEIMQAANLCVWEAEWTLELKIRRLRSFSTSYQIMAWNTRSHILHLKKLLSEEFDMKDLGSVEKILGMEIHRDRKAKKRIDARGHLIYKGFIKGYTKWVAHGEVKSSVAPLSRAHVALDVIDDMQRLLHDRFYKSSDEVREGATDVAMEGLNAEAEKFYKLLQDSQEILSTFISVSPPDRATVANTRQQPTQLSIPKRKAKNTQLGADHATVAIHQSKAVPILLLIKPSDMTSLRDQSTEGCLSTIPENETLRRGRHREGKEEQKKWSQELTPQEGKKMKRSKSDQQRLKDPFPWENLTPLNVRPSEILYEIKDNKALKWLEKMTSRLNKRNKDLWCHFHNDHGHTNDDCGSLKRAIEALIKHGQLRKWVARKEGQQETPSVTKEKEREENAGTINTIYGGLAAGGSLEQARKAYAKEVCITSQLPSKKLKTVPLPTISFSEDDVKNVKTPQDDPLFITIKAGNFDVKRVLVDNGTSAEVLFYDAFKKMNIPMDRLQKMDTPLYGFSNHSVIVEGVIALPVAVGMPSMQANLMLDFVVVRSPLHKMPYLDDLNLISCKPWYQPTTSK
ncbi:hypothetical protein RJ639_014857 [Escallonia herrerae]|uniref:Retrovirus-related Pol polyprotein from transposon TNT 1-94-like beta-barrel domain-containing protein n=1 Tax=Escallonia herrerae TaxID=1293975 RepID=A0AA89ALK4_9ASTE|nr:hypothetical protein RJ639_014857 [Escallonia herrerae]